MGRHCPKDKSAKTVPFFAGVSTLGHIEGRTGSVSHGLILQGGHNITLKEHRHKHACATVKIIALEQSAQTQNLFDLTLAGNTSGALALISSGTMTLAGGNNITLSQAGNAITISGPNQGPGSFSAGVSNLGNSSGTTGTVTNQLVFVGGNNITLSQSTNGQSGTITISAFNQSVQTQNIIRDVNIIGNTAGTTADITSGTLYLAGGDDVILVQDGNSITISIAVDTITNFSAGVSDLGNTAGTTGTVNCRLVLVGNGEITLSQSINGCSATVTIDAHPAIDAISLLGNTSGTLSPISTGTMYLAGGNNITLSQDQNSITISAFNQSQQTQNIIRDVNIGGNTSGTTANITSGTLSLIGGYNITLSQNANTITISGGEVLTAVVSNLGNTAGLTGSSPVGMDKLIFVGGSNITLNQTFVGENFTITFNAQSQSTQTENIINDVNIIGNTSGTTANITSGTLFLAGGNEITLSQVGNSITISGAEDTVTQFSIGVSNLGNSSGTTGTVDNRVVFVGGNNITLSQSIDGQSATITISGFEDTVTQYSAGMSTGGNTTGTTGLASQRLILAGGGDITLSGSTNAGSMTITIAFSETVSQFSAGMSDIGNTSGTSGMVSQILILAGGNNITLSQSLDAGSATLTISAQSQSQQTQNIIRDVNIAGNTSGTTADITSGTMTLAGGNNITLSQNGNAITISAAAVGAGSFSAGISTLGNTSGTSGTVANQLIFAGGDNITVSQSIDGQSATITISAAAVGAGSFSAGISTGGNTSGTSGTVANQLVFAGGNNITLSQSINGQSATITVSAFTQTVQTQSIINDVVISGNTSGTTANITSGTLTLAGGNGIVLSQVGNAITISEHALSAGVSNLGNTSGTTGTVHDRLVFVGGNNITLIQSTNANSATLTISAFEDTVTQFSAGMSNLGNTDGTTGTFDNRFILAGGAGITLSQSIDAANHSGTITINAESNTITQFSIGVSNLGNSSGTTGTVDNRVVFVGGNNITLSQSINGQSATITVSAFTQTVQTQNRFDLTLNGNTTGTLALVSSGTLTLAGGNNITLSQSGNAVTISAFNQTTQTQNLFDLTLSGNTSGTLALVSSGTLTLAGGNNITLNQDGNAVTVSGGDSYSAGISNLGNTSGTSNLVSQQLILVGGNNVTLSQSTNGGSATLTISGGNSYSAGVSTGGNTSGTTGLVSQRLVLVGGNNITLSQSTNGGSATVTISAQNQSQTLQLWDNLAETQDNGANIEDATFWLAPLTPGVAGIFPGAMTVNTMYLDISANATITASNAHTWKVGIYTLNGSTLSLHNSVQTTWSFSANTNNTRLFQGRRFLTIHSSLWSASPTFSKTLYYAGLIMHSAGSNIDIDLFGFSYLDNNQRSGTMGVSTTSGNTSMGYHPFVGVSISSRNATAALPTTIGLDDLAKTGSRYVFIPHIIFNNVSSNF